ncbi:MAG: type I restriction-modification system subunit M [Synechococcus sp.]
MPDREDLTDALIALIPEDGSRISNGEIKAALERQLGEPVTEGDLEEAKRRVVAMGAAEKARGPGGGLKAAGVEAPPRAAAGQARRNGHGIQGRTTADSTPTPVNPPQDPGDPSRGFTGWVAPAERDLGKAAMEKSLWEAADQFRANSGLKAQEYSAPILGLIFLRFADARFTPQWQTLKAAGGSERRGSREEDPNAYQSEGLLYLPPGSRYQELLELPEGADVGARLNEAMGLIEQHNSKLAGVLPRSYNLFTPQLLKELLKRISEIPTDLEFDAFGRIYEYFLLEFARTEGQKGGEFFTPTSQVMLITEIVEPFAGRLLDPASGSGGMYVQSARFVKAHRGNPAGDLAICGVEKTDDTGRLCRMNLAVHGLEGRIFHGGDNNSYYVDPHDSVGAFDYVMANPPFNVNAVDMAKLSAATGPGRRFPFGTPSVDNANYLWIQLFYSSLNEKGRAGFVMANSASDARGSEQAIRQKLIEAKAVDVMVAVGPNMFYTVTLPCTLWFFDRGKLGTQRENTVLFVDARHIYRQIDRAHRDWSEAQIGFLANIVRLFRGEAVDVTLGGEEAQRWIEAYFGTEPEYRDIAGLCKAATLEAIEAQGWSLNPGRYVGVAAGEDLSDEDFKEQLEQLQEELEGLNAQARELEVTIATNVAGILGGP